jgi:hypothetical protein
MIDSRRHGIALLLGTACTAAAILIACDDSDETTPSRGSDASADRNVTQPGTDSAAPITPSDGGSDANQTVDSGPTTTRTIGATGYFEIRHDSAFITFYEDDTFVRWSNAAECVMHVRASTKQPAAAGVVTIGGPVVGTDGGLPTEVQLQADPAMWGNNQYIYPDIVYPASAEPVVQVAAAELAPTFPALVAQSLRPSSATVAVTSPPNTATTILSSTQGFSIAWTAPTGANVANQRFIMSLKLVGNTLGSKTVFLSCAFPLSAGAGTIPANVLADAKAMLNDANVSGPLVFSAGGYAHVSSASSSYVVEVSRIDGTSWPTDRLGKIQ